MHTSSSFFYHLVKLFWRLCTRQRGLPLIYPRWCFKRTSVSSSKGENSQFIIAYFIQFFIYCIVLSSRIPGKDGLRITPGFSVHNFTAAGTTSESAETGSSSAEVNNDLPQG